MPLDTPVLGSFESWSRTLGGVLSAAGVEGFLVNSNQLYERSTEDAGSWEAFLGEWRRTYGEGKKAAKKVASDLYSGDYQGLADALPDEFGLLDEGSKDKNLGRKLGAAFSKREGVRYGAEQLRIERGGSKDRAVLWTVKSGSSPKGGSEGPSVGLFGRAGDESNESNESNESPTPRSTRARAHEGRGESDSSDSSDSLMKPADESIPVSFDLQPGEVSTVAELKARREAQRAEGEEWEGEL